MPCDAKEGGPVLARALASWAAMFADDADELMRLALAELGRAAPGGMRHSHLQSAADRLTAARGHAREAAAVLRTLPEDAPPAPAPAGSAYEEVAH